MFQDIKVDYILIDTLEDTEKYLDIIEQEYKIIACDFETANRLTKDEIDELKLIVDTIDDNEEKRNVLQQINADGLSHPSLSTITHLSIAGTNNKAYVFITLDTEIQNYIYNWLITTEVLQLWHNSLFDFKFIFHNTNKLPKNYFDTQLYMKTINNNANSIFSNVRLKHLMAHKYGRWAESRDVEFTIENSYDSSMLLYAATDACATYELYQEYYVNKKFNL